MQDLKEKIQEIQNAEKDSWEHLIYGMGNLYQSFESLGLKGQRSTEERIEIYELKRFLKKCDDVLDIGGNTGFIDLQISDQINSSEVVEVNPHLCKIGRVVREKINAKNIEFYEKGFEDFKTEKKYSAIFSFAADEVADGLSKLDFIEYLNKIDFLLKEGGLLFFESQASDIMEGKWDKKEKILKSRYEILLKKEFKSEYPVNAKERVFMILKKIKKPNLILITLDGMRQDRLHLVKPLNSIANENIYFSNMITAAPYTIASMHSIFSGLYPHNNGVNSYFNVVNFNKKIITLAQYLKEAGYYTFSDVYGDIIIPSRGFDKINVYDENNEDIDDNEAGWIRKLSEKERFFIHLQPGHIHRFSVNEVAKKYDDFDEEYFTKYNENVKNYDNNLKKVETYFNKILPEINKLENTITIIFSDHGTSNGEKIGEKLYGCYLHHYTIKSFCIIILPNKKQIKIPYQIRSVDLLPTILDFLNIKSRQKQDGKSLVSFIEGLENKDRMSFTETGRLNKEFIEKSRHNLFCLCDGDTKFTYDLENKKFEFTNIEEEMPED